MHKRGFEIEASWSSSWVTFYKNGRDVNYLYIRIFDFTIVVYNLKQIANISIYDLLLYTILAMESRLYGCPTCGKSVKSTYGLTKHVNTYKIPIFLPYCQLSNPDPVLNYNTTNPLDLPSDNSKEDMTSKISNHGHSKVTRPANIGNNKEDIRLANLDKQRPTTSKWTL